jgi:hypothetical protein
MNLIIHKYKKYKKWRSYLTIAFFTFLKYDALDMLDNAAKKLDYHLYTKTRENEQSTKSYARNSNKKAWRKI